MTIHCPHCEVAQKIAGWTPQENHRETPCTCADCGRRYTIAQETDQDGVSRPVARK